MYTLFTKTEPAHYPKFSSIWKFCFIGLLLCWGATPCFANPMDMFGFGAARGAMGNTGAANAFDTSSAYYNPATSALSPLTEVSIGYSYAQPSLHINGNENPQETARGWSIGLVMPGRILSFPVGLSLALYIPDQHLIRIKTIPHTRPRFFRFDNDIHRLYGTATVSIQLHKKLSIGVGFSILADAIGKGARLELQVDLEKLKDPKSHRSDASVDVEVPTRFTPVAGLLFRPTPHWNLGLTFRGPLSTLVEINSTVQLDAAVLQGDITLGVKAFNYYTPTQLALGVGYTTCPPPASKAEKSKCGHVPEKLVFTASLELTWSQCYLFHRHEAGPGTLLLKDTMLLFYHAPDDLTQSSEASLRLAILQP